MPVNYSRDFPTRPGNTLPTSKESSGKIELELSLEKSRRIPLYRQIYEQIREKILAGDYLPGEKLPPGRLAARSLGVARITVVKAYEHLEAEGYIEKRVGSGTYISRDLSELLPIIGSQGELISPVYSRWGERVISEAQPPVGAGSRGHLEIDFGFGRSFPHIFPYAIWRRLLVRYLSTDDSILSRYGSVAGFFPLREAVADYVRRLRGVVCTADQVIIVNGIQQALDILARLLLSPGDEVLVENPGYADAFKLFRAFGAQLIALQVDDCGFPVESISASCQARLTFVTPSNQFPRGGTMPLSRRLALLKWANKVGAMILEDDYDGELRYGEHPLAALQGLDRTGRVIYLGTFSKVLFPALRLGYIILPEVLITPFIKAMRLVDRGAPTLTQAAVADFINEGHFERHLGHLRQEYGERRKVLVRALEKHLHGTVRYSKVEAGLHVMLLLPANLDEQEVVMEAAKNGVGVYPGSAYHIEALEQPSILLGYSGLRPAEIEEGVARLASILNRLVSEADIAQKMVEGIS